MKEKLHPHSFIMKQWSSPGIRVLTDDLYVALVNFKVFDSSESETLHRFFQEFAPLEFFFTFCYIASTNLNVY